MEARAAKCAFTLHSPALQNPQTGWITLTRTNFGSVCLCQHGPPATVRCCSQSCIKWENPVSSRAKESLTLLNRIDSLLSLLCYWAGNKINLTWRTQMPKPAEKLYFAVVHGYTWSLATLQSGRIFTFFPAYNKLTLRFPDSHEPI